MTKANQKKLYDHFVKLSKEGKSDVQRANCKRYAEDILKSFPDFKKEEPKKEEPKTNSKGKGAK